jgi:hypothetical protein
MPAGRASRTSTARDDHFERYRSLCSARGCSCMKVAGREKQREAQQAKKAQSVHDVQALWRRNSGLPDGHSKPRICLNLPAVSASYESVAKVHDPATSAQAESPALLRCTVLRRTVLRRTHNLLRARGQCLPSGARASSAISPPRRAVRRQRAPRGSRETRRGSSIATLQCASCHRPRGSDVRRALRHRSCYSARAMQRRNLSGGRGA